MNLLQKINGEVTYIPPNHKSSIQWAVEWCVGARRARELLAEGVKRGIVGIAHYKVRQTGGQVIKVPHYYDIEENQEIGGSNNESRSVADTTGERRPRQSRRKNEPVNSQTGA